MFYRPEEGHGLPHNPFNAIIVPRPIAWISTRSADGGRNLAPYSFFNGVAYEPPQVMFATTSGKPDRPEMKDTLANIRETGVFCVNVVPEAMKEAMNITSATLPAGEDEFERAGLDALPCETIDCPRVKGVPAALECTLTEIVRLPGKANHVCFGTVRGVHLDDGCIVNGKFDATVFRPLARMGYREYTVVERVFEMPRPDEKRA